MSSTEIPTRPKDSRLVIALRYYHENLQGQERLELTEQEKRKLLQLLIRVGKGFVRILTNHIRKSRMTGQEVVYQSLASFKPWASARSPQRYKMRVALSDFEFSDVRNISVAGSQSHNRTEEG